MLTINRFFRTLTPFSFCVAFSLSFHSNVINAEGLSAAGISPTRVVVPANQRSASVTLTNTSSVEIAYRMTLIEMGLNKNGHFTVLRDDQIPSTQRSAKPIIRFSPRQVRLKPGASQVVRAIVRRAAIPEPGEYRSHLRLQALPILSNSELANASSSDLVLVQSSAAVEVGVTIPIIIRDGSTEANVTLNEVTIDFDAAGKADTAKLLLGLTGNRSTYGDIYISLITGEKEKEIGMLKAFALYYPYPQEWVHVNFNDSISREDIGPNSRIRVRFENKSVDSAHQYWLDDSIKPSMR